jgi:hypothetical protein
MNRGKGRGRPRRDGGQGPPGRRTPPPDATGIESQFFERAVQAGAPLVVKLIDGGSMRGVVREFDRDQLTLEGEGGPIVVRKSEIRYLYEE